jgi:hypothetical protein
MVPQFDALSHAEMGDVPQGLTDVMIHAESPNQE